METQACFEWVEERRENESWGRRDNPIDNYGEEFSYKEENRNCDVTGGGYMVKGVYSLCKEGDFVAF